MSPRGRRRPARGRKAFNDWDGRPRAARWKRGESKVKVPTLLNQGWGTRHPPEWQARISFALLYGGVRALPDGDAAALGDFAGGFFKQFVDESLVGFGLLGGHAPELAEQLRCDANGDELFCVSRSGAADSASATQFGICGFRNVEEVKLAIRYRPGALCGSPGAR